MQLTEHFSLSEFQHSDTASRLGINNTIPEALIPNIRNLCTQVLEPLRGYYGRPIIITSGYRSPPLNKAVGGVANSQHMAGEAADIQAPRLSPEGGVISPEGGILTQEGRRKILMLWMAWIMDNCRFDQLIFEKCGTSMWLHISCKLAPEQNRQQVKSIIK